MDSGAGDDAKSSQELLPEYTEQEERQLTCPDGVRLQAVLQQPELRGVSARARPRVAAASDAAHGVRAVR